MSEAAGPSRMEFMVFSCCICHAPAKAVMMTRSLTLPLAFLNDPVRRRTRSAAVFVPIA